MCNHHSPAQGSSLNTNKTVCETGSPAVFRDLYTWVANTYLVVFDTFLFCFKRGGGQEGRERKGKREAGKGRKRREEGRGENNLVTFLQLRPCLLVRMRSPPDIINNCDKFIRQYKQCSYSDLHSEARYRVHSGQVFLTAGAPPKTGRPLKGVRVVVLKAPGFGCSQSSILFTVILGVLLICVLWRFFPWL